MIPQGSVSPVKALCVHNQYIFAGCGSVVQVYRAGTSDLVTSVPTLPCTAVHGFRLGPVVDGKKTLCVFGGKCARILYIITESAAKAASSPNLRLNTAAPVREFEDWIWDAVWLQGEDAVWTLGLATAHNFVLHWDWSADTILQRVTCAEKCIIYCGHFIGSRWSDLVLAAGTVFNQVVLWCPGRGHQVEGAGDQPQPVLHRLTGHQGVIFSIFYHNGLQRICSVSDDRSIILYQLCFPAAATKTGGASDGVVDWASVTISPMLTLFGHSARVWDVVLLADQFVSVGEDAHCIVWSYSGDIIYKHKGHKGHSIWSMAASEDESFLVTGGGDCSIRQWHLEASQDLHLAQLPLTIPDSVKTVAGDFVRTLALWDYDTVILSTNAGSLLRYAVSSDRWEMLAHDTDFASYSTIAVSTHKTYLAVASITGHVRLFVQGHETESATTETKTSVHTGKICGVTWVSDDHLLTTGLHGQCVLSKVTNTSEGTFTLSSVARLELLPCKHRWVVSGCLVSLQSSSSLDADAHLVCGDRSGSIHHYQLKGSGDAVVLHPAETFPKIHGSAGVTSMCFHDNTVFSTGRDGQYRRWTLSQGHLQFLNSSRVFKGFDWIDHLWTGEEGIQVLGFYSSKFVIWDVTRGEKEMEVECGGGHRAWDCLFKGHSYRFLFIKAREVVMVNGGRRSTQNIVKPPLHGMKVWDVRHIRSYADSSGGVHHVLCTASEDTTLSLGMLVSDSQGGSLQWTGQHTLHSHLSSVRTLVAVPSAAASPERREGADDVVDPVNVNPSHLSGRTGAVSKDGKDSQSHQSTVVFSAGGRAQIQAWRVTVTKRKQSTYQSQVGLMSGSTPTHFHHAPAGKPCVAEDIVMKSASPETDSSGGVHIHADSSLASIIHSDDQCRTEFSASYEHLGGCFLGESRHKRSHKPWKTRYLKLDPETRVMCLSAVGAHQLDVRLPACLYLLAAAGSDGILRLFLFDERLHHFTLLCQSSHHSGCVLKVLIHLHQSVSDCSSSGARPFLFSAATDGRIAVWDLQPVVEWLVANKGQTACGGGFLTDGEKAWPVHSAKKNSESRELEEEPQLDQSKELVRTMDAGGSNVADNEDSEGDLDRCSPSMTAERPGVTRAQYLGDGPSPVFEQVFTGDRESNGKLGTESSMSWTPAQEFVAHQSGVNSLHVKSFADGSVLLVSGGDDNALTVHRLTLATHRASERSADAQPLYGGAMFDITAIITKPDAHAAQITGVWLLSMDHIVTSSIDQRVILWCLTPDAQVKQVSCRFVDVADLASMDVWQYRDKVYVGLSGEGLALLSFDTCTSHNLASSSS